MTQLTDLPKDYTGYLQISHIFYCSYNVIHQVKLQYVCSLKTISTILKLCNLPPVAYP